MSLDREQVVRGNVIPEGLVVPHSASWPPDAADGQLHWHLPEQRMYVYDASGGGYWVPVSVQQQYHFEPILEDYVRIVGSTFGGVRASFFSRWLNRTTIIPLAGTEYDALWRFTYWQFSVEGSSVWSAPTQFPTEDAFFDFLESYVPSSGGVYSTAVSFRTFDAVDDADPYPTLIRHRNSLVASMKGQYNWCRGRQYGIDGKFNASSYYANFYNQVGQRFINQRFGTDPGSNNDGVVWYHRGKNGTLWRWPKVGTELHVTSPSDKPVVYDSTANTYVLSPVPTGQYIFEDPFFLVEYTPNFLSIVAPVSGNDWTAHRANELFNPTAMVFPAHLGQYYGFLVVPHGSDSFVTNYLDTGNYDLQVCCKYRHTTRKAYFGPVATHVSDAEHSLFNLRGFPFQIKYNKSRPQLDTDMVPVQVDICRRNRSTGMRSKWFTAYNVNRRLVHASFRVDPAPWKR